MLPRSNGGSVESSNMTHRQFSEGGGDGNNHVHIDYGLEVVRGQEDASGEMLGIGIDTDGSIEGCKTTDMLSGDTPASKLTISDLRKIRLRFHIPRHVSLHAPSSEVRADWDLPGQVCLYELPFKEGFRLPLPRLVTEVCDYYCISPAQLMPNAWRVLLAIELFCEINLIEFSGDEVRTAYKLKECNKDIGRYQLNSRSIRTPLIPKLKDCDKHWKGRYFFLPFDSLELPSNCHVSRTWAVVSCTGIKFEPQRRKVTARRIRKFPSHSEDSHQWENILIEANLRGSNLWRLVPLHQESIVIPPPRTNPWFLILNRAAERLYSNSSLSLFSDLTPVERAFADYVMSHTRDIPLGGDDAIEIFKEKRAAKDVVAKGKFAVAISPPFPIQKKKRAAIVDNFDWSTNDIHLNFPHSASAYSDFGPQAAEVGKLLWPEDKDRLEDLSPANAIKYGVAHSFQSMQTLLFLYNKVDELCGQVKTLRAKKNALQAEKTRFTSNKLEADKLLAELRVQLCARDSDVSRLQTEVESLSALVAGEEERLYMAAMEAEIKLKAKMMEDYQNGYAETWNAEKIFVARDELERITASDAIPTEKLGDILGDMISEDRAQDEQQVGGAENNRFHFNFVCFCMTYDFVTFA